MTIDALLLQVAQLCSLNEPRKKDLRHLQNFLESEAMVDSLGGFALLGADRNTWGSTGEPYDRAHDLVSMVEREPQDFFSKWCTERAMDMFFKHGCHRSRKPDKVNKEVFYRQEVLERITYFITTALASLLLVLSITILWLVTSMKARLLIIASFNVMLTLCLVVFTTTPRASMFAITAG
jgi:hypothetical protein